MSPDVGELDEQAFRDALDADADEALCLLADLAGATDQRLRALARQLAARLFIDLVRDRAPDRPGIGRITTAPFRSDGADLDLDATLDGLTAARAERRAVDPDDLRVRAWSKPSTSWCLLLDRSGSMNGAPVATAALAAAAIAHRADPDYSVLSFADDVVAVRAMWERRPVDDVVDRVLALRGHGTTDLAAALLAAGAQLRRSGAGRRVAVLLSDCRATEPGDVVGAARTVDELVIVAPAGDDHDARRLADDVGARLAVVDGPSTILAALSSVLDR